MMVIGNTCGKLQPRFSIQPCALLSLFEKRWFESNASDEKAQRTLGKTNIIMQNGIHIQEVPFAVKKVRDIAEITIGKKWTPTVVENKSEHLDGTTRQKQVLPRPQNTTTELSTTKPKETKQRNRIDIQTEDGTAVLYGPDLEHLKEPDSTPSVDGSKSCSTAKKIYSFLENKVVQDENSKMALEGLRKIIQLENTWHRGEYDSPRFRKIKQRENDVINRDLVLTQLAQFVAKSQDNDMIVEGLMVLKKDRFSPPRNDYRDWLCDEALSRAVDGGFTIEQLTNIVQILSSYKHPRYFNSVDVLWAIIASKQNDITAETIVPLFKILKYFTESRNMMKIILEKKLAELWPRLSGSQMAEILNCFNDNIGARNCLLYASEWANTNLSSSKEKDLISFVHSLNKKGYIDDNVEKALEQYLKKKSLEIKDSNLMAAIAGYYTNMQVKNLEVLSACGEYFIKNGGDIPPHLLVSILTSFGTLNVTPPRPTEFWNLFNEVLSMRFADLRPIDALDIFLSCAYVEKYFTNLFSKVFTSQFLNRVRYKKNRNLVNHIQVKLKLLDAAMVMECAGYGGPRVPEQRMLKPLFPDIRIKKAINSIYSPLASIVGDTQKLSKNVVLSQLPLISFYVLDIVIHPSSTSSSVFSLPSKDKKNDNIAVFINLPEHYCKNTRDLIGAQLMKQRHIRKLGFRVMSLDYTDLKSFLNQPDKLLEYLTQRLTLAGGPL